MNRPLLEAHQLRVEIAGKTVVDRIDLQVAGGERLAILGRNGAGKSTLLSVLAGLTAPDSGAVAVGGATLDVTALPAWRDSVAYVVQEPYLFRDSVRANVTADTSCDDAAIWSVLELVGADTLVRRLEGGLDTLIGEGGAVLSGGERQRLAIATLLTQAAPLYLLDEPLSHLDLNHQMAVLELFAGTARDCGAGVVMVLHDPALAHRFCDRALLVHGDGRTEQGPVDTILTAEKLSQLYGYGLRQLDDRGHRCFIPE